MNGKRFECVFKEHETNNCWSMIKDNQLDKPFYIKDVVTLLNEQQATINNQEQKIKILQQEISDTQAILEMLTEKLKGWK